MKIGSHVRMAVVLGIAGGVSSLALLPYLFEVMPEAHARLASSPVPFPIILLGQGVQAVVLLTLVSWIGLRLGAPLALDSPWLRRAAWRDGRVSRRRSTAASQRSSRCGSSS